MLYTDEAIKRRKRRETKIKNKINIIVYVLLIPILIYNLFLIIQAIIKPQKTPDFLGIKTYVIISGSMQPNLNIGDIVIVKNVKVEDLQEGDIISFRQGQSVITHRISEIISNKGQIEYKTKGDNNNTEDSGTIKYDAIEGKVVRVVPNLGKIALALQGKIVIICILIIFYIYLSYSGAIKRRKNQRRIKRIEYENKKKQL